MTFSVGFDSHIRHCTHCTRSELSRLSEYRRRLRYFYFWIPRRYYTNSDVEYRRIKNLIKAVEPILFSFFCSFRSCTRYILLIYWLEMDDTMRREWEKNLQREREREGEKREWHILGTTGESARDSRRWGKNKIEYTYEFINSDNHKIMVSSTSCVPNASIRTVIVNVETSSFEHSKSVVTIHYLQYFLWLSNEFYLQNVYHILHRRRDLTVKKQANVPT